MSKNIRKRLLGAIQSRFRSSTIKSKTTSVCCSLKKPDDYDFVSYQPKQTASRENYIELSECYSSRITTVSKDSGISSNGPLQSTRIDSEDAASLNFSSITYNDVPARIASFQCCRCQCHHSLNLIQSFVPIHQQNQVKTKLYPFIF